MSDRPTPETDAVCEDIGMGCMMVASEFARKLERERDEARDDAQRKRVELNHLWQANEMAEEAFRERDEARAWAEKVERNACQHSIRAEAAERERDEAREERDKMQSALNVVAGFVEGFLNGISVNRKREAKP